MRVLAVLASTVMLLAACGGGDDDAEPASPQALAEAWLAAAGVEGGAEASLPLIAPEVRANMDEDAYRACIGDAVADLERLNIKILERNYDDTVEVDGSVLINVTYVMRRANTTLDLPDTLEVVETDEGWRVVGSVANEGCISQSTS